MKCKECKNEYEDTLKVCPHCGFENKNIKDKKIIQILLYVLTIYSVILSMGIMFRNTNTKSKLIEDYRVVYSNEIAGNIAYSLNSIRTLGTTICLIYICLSKYLLKQNEKMLKTTRIVAIIILVILQILPLFFAIIN